jgi:hydroxymethylpyrimidine pyrophosphatase-like HAD family hydrolase
MTTNPTSATLRLLYTDLDGTLLGPGGSLFAGQGGKVTARAAAAVVRLHEAGVQLVLVSGRTQAQTREVARVVGAQAYIAETGALIVDRGDLRGPETTTTNFGTFTGKGAPFDEMVRSGVGGFLMERNPGSLEPHTPWSSQHRVATMLFRGFLDLEGSRASLAAANYDWVGLVDNGVIPRTYPGLDVPEVRAYHLVPKDVSKASGVHRHLATTDINAHQAAAVGDSLSDLEIGGEVGSMFITANGRAAVGNAASGMANVTFTESANGDGFAEAVDALLG